jgi:hypothetical protein
MVRFARGVEPVVFAAPGDSFRTFDHLAFCAWAILRREAADMIRVGWLTLVWVLPPLTLPRTERAASTCLSSFTRFVLSARSSDTIEDNPFSFAMNSLSIIRQRPIVEGQVRYCLVGPTRVVLDFV